MNRRAFLAATILAPLAAKAEDLADLRELESAIARNAGKPLIEYLCLFQRTSDGSYSIDVPALDITLFTGAQTLDEARENARTAIVAELDYCRENHLPVPPRSMMEAGWVETGLTPAEIREKHAKIGIL